MKGLRLADGREVVIKVRPRMARLAGCAAVHRALWTAGFPCPEPLTGLQSLDGHAATAGPLVQDAGEPPPDNELAALSAAALARLVELALDPEPVPSLAPSPFWAGDPEQILTRHEAGARLRLGGLDPGLAGADGLFSGTDW